MPGHGFSTSKSASLLTSASASHARTSAKALWGIEPTRSAALTSVNTGQFRGKVDAVKNNFHSQIGLKPPCNMREQLLILIKGSVPFFT